MSFYRRFIGRKNLPSQLSCHGENITTDDNGLSFPDSLINKTLIALSSFVSSYLSII